MNTACRLGAALFLPLALNCHAADGLSGRLDLRMPRTEHAAPRLLLVTEPAFAAPAPNLLARPALSFEDGDGPMSLPRGALRVQLSRDSSLSLRPRRHGVAVAWRKRF